MTTIIIIIVLLQ